MSTEWINARSSYVNNARRVVAILVLCFAFIIGTMPVAAAEGDSDEERTNSFSVNVRVDGETRQVTVTGGNVADTLSRADVMLGPNDKVSIPLSDDVDDGDTIVVTRVSYATVTKDLVIPYETHTLYSPTLPANAEKVTVEGRDGKRVTVVEQTIVDGEVVNETVISDDITSQPVHREVVSGFPVKPVSSMDFGYSFDERGDPVGYSQVFRSQRSTAYTWTGNRTSTGREAAVGHVAVNPNVIPYGSKLYIRSSDGRQIYGYAIAADTGGAMMSGSAFIDLYYNTNEECIRYGVRSVDIFILD